MSHVDNFFHTCTASFEIHVDAQEEQQNNEPHRGLAMIGLGAQSNPGTTVKLLSDKLSALCVERACWTRH